MSSIQEGMYKAQLLTETRTYKLWESAGRKIVEAQLTVDQINKLFANIEQGATAAGGNRTAIGKGKDVASAVNKAWEDLKTKASNSGPIKNMDAMYDQAAEKLKQATGGDQGVMKYVQKYRDFAKKHPVAQSLIYGTLIAAAGITGAGVGGAAALGLFKMVDKLLQGEKFSSAAYQGAKTGAMAYGASKVGDLIRGNQPAANMKTTASGERSWGTDSGDAAAGSAQQQRAMARMAQARARNYARIDANESVLSEETIALLFTRIDEGLWDTIKGKAQQFGKNLTTKVTADKLMKMWKAEGSPTDSKQLVFFLTQKAGVAQDVVNKVFAQMKISTADPKQQAMKRAPGNFAKPAGTKQAGPRQPKPAAAPAQPATNATVAGTRQQGGAFAGKSLYKEGNAADDSAEFKHKVSNIIRQNPKGSASEKILLGRFLNSDQGTYARTLLGKNHKGWIEHISSWLNKNKRRLQQEFTELDFNDIESLAYDMYENYLAKQGQLEEASKAEVRAELDQAIKDFLAKGGQIEKLKPNKVRAIPGMGLASKHIGTAGEINRKTRSKMLVGKGRNIQGNKPVVNVEEGEVVSMQARKTPLVIAGSPFDWNIYDLRTNKMVANILGGDRRESKLYEIRINSNGMTPSTKMLPTYVLTAGPDDNPPYKAYELVDTPERYGKIEKSPGPGGTTKLRPDQDDVLRHFFKVMGGGKYYGYDLALVEEGLDQYELVEKALGAKIMEVDDAMELDYTDWDPKDSSSIVYLGNKKNEGYSAGASGGAGLGEKINTPGGMGQSYRKYTAGPSGQKKNETAIPMFTPETKMVNANDPGSDGWKVYKVKPSGVLEGILQEYNTKEIDEVIKSLPNGLTVNNFTIPAFKEYLLNKYYTVEKPNWDKLWAHFANEYNEKHGIKEYKLGDLNYFDDMLLVLPKGLDATGIKREGFKEFIYQKHGNKEWTDFKKNRFVFWDAYQKAGKTQEKKKFLGLFDEETNENLLNTYGDQLGLDEDVYTDSLYKEFLDSEYNKDQGSYIESLRNLGQFIRSKDIPEEKAKPIIRKLVAKLHPSGLNEDQIALAELKCWQGYTRVKGIPAGAPGSCKKKTKESSIMKGLQAEEYLPHYTPGGKIYKSFTPADKLKNEPGSDTSDLENEANKEQLRKKMKEVLQSLPERQRQVLLLRFYKNKTLDQVAKIMNVSVERIRQLESKAFYRIRTYFRGLDSFILDKARDSESYLKSFFGYIPSRTDEYKEVDTQRKIEFSKENPPDLYYLYQQFIQRMLNPENTIDPYEWIDKVNKHYGLNYTWKDYQKRGHNDHTNNWQKIIDKYILKK